MDITHAADHGTDTSACAILAKRLADGFHFQAGPHAANAPVPGFYAIFWDKYWLGNFCEFCNEPELDWHKVSHGATLSEAIKAADQILLDEEGPDAP